MSLIPLIFVAIWIAFFVLLKKSRRFQQYRIHRREKVDDFLVSRIGMRFFFVGILTVIAMTVLEFLPLTDPSKMPMSYRLPLGIVSLVAAIALLGLFFGMWRYWIRFDDSGKWIKRACFVLLLVGFWWGSAIYYFIVYLPQFRRRQTLEA